MAAEVEHHLSCSSWSKEALKRHTEAESAFTVAPTSLSRASSCLSSIGCWRTFTPLTESHVGSAPNHHDIGTFKVICWLRVVQSRIQNTSDRTAAGSLELL